MVPFVEPPVATRGRPFIILFLRLRLGSSHEPARRAVAEKCRTFWILGAGGTEKEDRRRDEGVVSADILSALKALRSADEVVGFMAIEGGWPSSG